MRKVAWLATAFMVAMLSFSSSGRAATQLVSGGKLIGATGVSVLGQLYDVEFIDGDCAGLFSGCDTLADLVLLPGSGDDAAGALRDQVFLDTALGNFDSNPALTRGCGGPVCFVYIPSFVNGGPTFTADVFQNDESGPDVVTTGGNILAADSGNFGHLVFARFSVEVPEPATLALLGTGLLGLALRRKSMW